jgi:hypothetical protein
MLSLLWACCVENRLSKHTHSELIVLINRLIIFHDDVNSGMQKSSKVKPNIISQQTELHIS